MSDCFEPIVILKFGFLSKYSICTHYVDLFY